jgi:branched-chain amino acid transport system permease protein
MFAMGLSLSAGVMRFINIAHGDLIVFVSFMVLSLTTSLGLPPLVAALVTLPFAFVGGYLLQRVLLQRVLGKGVLPIILVTFGLSIIIQNGLLYEFTADSRRLRSGALEVQSFPIGGGIDIGVLPLVMFVTAIGVIALLQFVFYATPVGRAFRATSDDAEVARMMGIDNRHIFGLAMALSLAVVAIAGVFLGARTIFDPAAGPARLLFGFEAVIIGGLGNLWGTLAGGIILGVAQAIGAQIHPGWQLLAGHIVFLIVLAIRPRGLFPRIEG